MIEYINLKPESKMPEIGTNNPFKAIVIADEEVSPSWQAEVSSWLVQSGCLYMMAWGKGCSSWDDSVDMANIEAFNYEDVPPNRAIITTWHENETLNEVFVFSKRMAVHPTVLLEKVLIVHISKNENGQKLLKDYENV